jgi:hypothetical protein
MACSDYEGQGRTGKVSVCKCLPLRQCRENGGGRLLLTFFERLGRRITHRP